MSAPKNELCSIDGCDREVSTRGWCSRHYGRWYRHGDPLMVKPSSTPKNFGCSVDGCISEHRGLGYCVAHYKRFKRWGDPLGGYEFRTGAPFPGVNGAPDVVSAQGLTGCLINDCGRQLVARGRCSKHYMQWRTATPKELRRAPFHLRVPLPEERYRKNFDVAGPDECWPWKGALSKSGYGEFSVSPERGQIPAHVYAVELATGKRCPPNMQGCHRCDNPPCVNPDHVYYGTQARNRQDMLDRGRQAKGSRLPQAKLNEASALDIRIRFVEGESNGELAREFGVSPSVISHVVNGVTWKHVPGPIRTHGKPGPRTQAQRRANHEFTQHQRRSEAA